MVTVSVVLDTGIDRKGKRIQKYIDTYLIIIAFRIKYHCVLGANKYKSDLKMEVNPRIHWTNRAFPCLSGHCEKNKDYLSASFHIASLICSYAVQRYLASPRL